MGRQLLHDYVAKRRQKKRVWLKTTLLYVFIPLLTWGLAFFIWINWRKITNLFDFDNGIAVPKPSKQVEKPIKPSKPGQEKILEEDRKKLDDILKRKS